MSKRSNVKGGITSVALPIFIQDTTSSVGAGLGGLVFNTSGLVAEYQRHGDSSWTAISLVTKTLGTWVSGGFVSSGSRAGYYEFDLPNAAVAAGVRWVAVRLYGATNMLDVRIELELNVADSQVDAFGALKPTVAGRTLDVSTGGEAGLDWANVGSPTTTLNLSGTTIANISGSVGSINGIGFPSNFASLGINTSGHISRVTLVDTTTTNTDMRGTDNALKPTVTGRTLDVTTSGEAGIDWANIGTPTATVSLSNTTVARSSAVTSCEEVTGNIGGSVGSVLGNVGGNVIGSVGSIALNGITSNSLAASAISEIALGVNNEANFVTVINDQAVDIARAREVADKLDTLLVVDGSIWQYTANALELGPSGGSSGTTTILVNPIQATIAERLLSTNLYLFNSEQVVQPIGFVDENGTAIDITGLSFTFKIKDEDGNVVNSQTGITGTGNTVNVTIPPITPGTKCTSWSIRLTSTGKVWRHGPVIFKDVP